MHSLLSRLMGIFPAEATSPKYDELEYLYSQIFKVVSDGLTSYDKYVPAHRLPIVAVLRFSLVVLIVEL